MKDRARVEHGLALAKELLNLQQLAVFTEDQTWLGRTISAIETRLSDVLSGPPARPGCIPATTTDRAITQSLPVPKEDPALTPEQINPGLAPGIDAKPRK